MHSEQNLEARHVSISFGGIPALTDVDFMVRPGEIRALIGANGAGKSTLMKILSGANPGFTGQVLLGGEELLIPTPKAAQAHGIRIVSQEVDTALIPGLSVMENILMGDLHTRGGFINWKTVRLDAMIALKMSGCPVDVQKRVEELTIAEKQMVLLARVIARDSHFLLLDEPTASLSAAETQKLFTIIRRLAKQQHVGIILVSHRLPELLQICESMTVLRDGRLVETFQLDGRVREADIIRMMSGKEAGAVPSAAGGYSGKGGEALLIQGLCDTAGRLKNISLTVQKGEIVGIGGLSGAGKTELCRAIFGAHDCMSGTVRVQELPYDRRSPCRSVRRGLALIPEERRREGIWTEESLRLNLTSCVLPACTGRGGFLSMAKERRLAGRMIESTGIHAFSQEQKMRFLSGGNQQKAVIGKWLLTGASIFLFDEATKGVDAASREEIFTLIRELSDSGKSVLYLTGELDELPGLCNRVYVMYNGRICKELRRTDSGELMYYAAGGEENAD